MAAIRAGSVHNCHYISSLKIREILSAKVRWRRCVLCGNERGGRQVLSTPAASKPQPIQALCVQAFAFKTLQGLSQSPVSTLKAQRLAAVARALPAACGTEDLAN